MRYLVLLLMAASAGCSGNPAKPVQSSQLKPAALEQIKSLIGTPACNSDTQCRTLAVGARACGGPEGYLAWSTVHTPEPELRALAERYKTARQAQIAARGEISDCRFIADPGAVCRAGQCELGASQTIR